MKTKQIKPLGKKRWLVRIALVFILLLGIAVVYVYRSSGPKNYSKFAGKRRVSIQAVNGRYNFYRNEKPFMVMGGAGYTHIKELVMCGGNTIVCWDTSRLEITLREAAAYNIAVIIGLDIPGGENIAYYNERSNTDSLFKAYRSIVRRYKDHPSLISWTLGNELHFPFTLTSSPFYANYNRLLSMIHDTDPHHPVSTTVINVAKKNLVNIKWRVPALDYICINSYNKIKTLAGDLRWLKLVWRGPYLISEWAPNGGWEATVTSWQAPIENTSTKKAEQYYDLYQHYMPIKDPRFLGSLAFYWGSRQEYTYTWYSVFGEDNVPTEVMEVLRDCWRGTQTEHRSPLLKYMLVDNRGAPNNIILQAGSEHRATLLLEDSRRNDSLRYKWEILKEGWQHWGQTWSSFKKPAAENGLVKDSSATEAVFMAPLKAGPYRLFVTVYNNHGFCATANTPIYVEE